MDILNRAYSQLYDLYRSMTPGSRLTAGLLTIVVLLSVGYLFTHPTTSPETDLMHGVPVAVGQLPTMEAAFAKANLKGYEVRGASIYVPRGQEQAYWAALADAQALPPNIGDALSQAISACTPFENSTKSADRMRVARQIELSRIIRSMSGIENAYVLYDVDAKVGGFTREKLITATVCVKPVGSEQLEESRVSAIRHLVAGAIAGMKPENVTVSDLNGRTRYGTSDDAGSGENRYVSLKRAYEQDLKAKILNSLSFIPSVTVELSVALDREQTVRVNRKKHTPHKKQREKDEAAEREKQAARTEVPVQQPNVPSILNSLLNTDSKDKDDAEPAEETDHTASEQVEQADAGLKPVLATVSVGVPMSYFKKVWQERNPAELGRAPRTPNQAALDQVRNEETAMIQKHVAQLLPSVNGTTKAAELVTVTPFQDIPLQEPSAPNLSKDAVNWIRQSWSMLAVVAVALVSLLTLRSMFRRGPATTETKTTHRDTEDTVIESSPIPAPHARRFRSDAPTFRDELSELVEDDPDTAANVLRSWIGHTG